MSRAKRKKFTGRPNRLKKTAKRLAAYSAAAAATVVTSQDRSASAQEDVVWDIADIVVDSSTDPGILFNVISGATAAAPYSFGNSATGSFRLATFGTAYIAGPAYSYAAGFVDPYGFTSLQDDYRYPTILGAGVSVGPALTFGGNSFYASNGMYGWLNNFEGTKGFVGLQFDIGGSLHYGWAEITGVGISSVVLHGFGYHETAGAPSVTPTVTTEEILGDFNNDKIIDSIDWQTLLTNNQTDLSGLTLEEAYLRGDMDGDLDNDIYDFDLFRNAYEKANPGAAFPPVVPEPSSMLLLAAGAAGLGAWRRRRAG